MVSHQAENLFGEIICKYLRLLVEKLKNGYIEKLREKLK